MKDILQILSNQFYYHNGTMRVTYPALFGSSELVFQTDKNTASEFQRKVNENTLTLEDFSDFRQNSDVNQMFNLVMLNQFFSKSDSRFKLEMENSQVFLSVNGVQVPAPVPNGLWENMLAEIEVGNEHNLLAYIRFFANVQTNPFKPVRTSVMDFLRMKGEQYCITDTGNLLAFKQLKFFCKGNQIVRDAEAFRPILSNKIKKAPSAVNMFYLNGDPQITEGNFENIAKKYDSSNTVQWIGSVEYALSLNKNLDTYTDGWTRKMRIVEGLEVREPQQHVVTDPNVTCVKGLHIYPLNYNGNTFYNIGDTTLFVVEVKPTDIGAIPNKQHYDKSRCFAYTVKQMVETDADGRISLPEQYMNGIVQTGGEEFDDNIEFPEIDYDISTEYVVVEEPTRYDIMWGESDEDGEYECNDDDYEYYDDHYDYYNNYDDEDRW